MTMTMRVRMRTMMTLTMTNEDYKGKLYDDDESDDESLEGRKYRVPSARGKGAGQKPHPDHPPRPNTGGMTEA